jgi:hypothetical protein
MNPNPGSCNLVLFPYLAINFLETKILAGLDPMLLAVPTHRIRC